MKSVLATTKRVTMPWIARVGRLAGFGIDDEDQADELAGPLAGRVPVVGVLAVNVLAALLFGPAFGSSLPSSIWVPVVVIAVVTYLLYEVARAWLAFEQWRGLTGGVIGLLVIVETTLRSTTASELPTGASMRTLYEGARRSWLLTLQSTLPARPDPELVVFVPMLMLAATLVSMQIVTRTNARLLSLLPAVLVAGLAQAYYALNAGDAVLMVIAFAVAAAAVLGRLPRLSVRVVTLVVLAVVPAVLLGSYAGAELDPIHRTAYALQDAVTPPPKPPHGDDPLSTIATDLTGADYPVFTVRGAPGVDRWPILVYTTYDGGNFNPSGPVRNIGSQLDINQPTEVPATGHSAKITVGDLMPGPFLPSQESLTSYSGRAKPVVYPQTGTLLKQPPNISYRLGYTMPDISAAKLHGAALTPHQPSMISGLSDLDAIIKVAHKIVPGYAAPTFDTAALIANWLQKNCHLATTKPFPQGHSIAIISHFLTAGTRIGTSEQFAAAFVLLAQVLGVPARIVVGYHQPTERHNGVYQVTSHNVFAWPEVSVAGVGWVPLDPTKGARSATSEQQSSLTDAVQKASQQPVTTPPARSKSKTGPSNNKPHPSPSVSRNHTNWWLISLLGLLGLVLLAVFGYLVGVPVAKWLRNRARRRRHGNSAIVSAWLETRDHLRDHGVDIRSDMTVRDVRLISKDLMNAPAERAMERLGDLVDSALWAGAGGVNRYPPDVAWSAFDTVRESLSTRPVVERVVAGLTLRSLRPMP